MQVRMPVNVDDKIRKLSPIQREKVEARAAELVAEFPVRAPVVLSGIADDEPPS